MEDILHTTPSLWETLKKSDKPIALFGMGDGADKILDVMEYYGLKASGIFASDGYARHNVFRGFTVKDYSTTKKELKDMIVLMAFGSQKPDVFRTVQMISNEQEFYSPDVPVAGSTLFTHSFVLEHLKEFTQVYHLLADDISKETYEGLIRFKLSGNPAYLADITTSREDIFSTIFPLESDEVFVDAGAYNGDTVQEFISLTKGNYKHIHAFEPSKKNYNKLVASTASLSKITTYHLGVWTGKDELFFKQTSGRGNTLAKGEANTMVDSIDHVLGGEPVTYINYDVEGVEREALEGSKQTIRTHHPKLWISAYHRSEDLFALPLQLLSICSSYDLYYRHNPYLPAWDIHLLALPKKEK